MLLVVNGIPHHREFFNSAASLDSEELMKAFWIDLYSFQSIVNKFIANPAKMKMTPQDEVNHKNATCCWFCDEKLDRRIVFTTTAEEHAAGITPDPRPEETVRDHCHVTGKYRGAAHNSCNLKSTLTFGTKIPVIFHNLQGYDSHLIIKAYNAQGDRKDRTSFIPRNSEKFLTFTIGRFSFIDSNQFLSSSLEGLVSTLSSKTTDFSKYIKGFIQDVIKSTDSHQESHNFSTLSNLLSQIPTMSQHDSWKSPSYSY